MNNNLLQIDYIINIGKFQKIQDDIAEATEMAILTVDYRGIPITRHSRCSDFCKIVRKHQNYAKLCQKCDARGGLEAARIQQPYIYLCHFGLIDFAIPIIVNDQYLGAVMAGQVLIKNDEKKQELENIVNTKYDKIHLNIENELEGLREKLPVMSLEKIKAVANMMFHISNYIIGEAILKISLNELNQKILLSKLEQSEILIDEFSNHELSGDSKNHAIQVEEVEPTQNTNVILRPAIEYIQKNYFEKLYLDQIASICNISPSYFSKLFKREMGDSFSNYVNKVKITKAKDLLTTTDTPIMNISYDLGFEDCGYFIKVFKKLENETPAVYRKKHSIKNR